MHEMSITQSIVAIVAEQAGSRKVVRVTLEIGKLSALMPEAIRFCFDIVAEGSPLAGAALDIIEIPGRANCLDCGATISLNEVYGRCPCGSWRLDRISGDEMNIKSMELEIV